MPRDAAAPDELLAALRRARALGAFEALPPSHRRRWIDHVAEATRPDARARRIERCVRELAGAAPAAGYSGTPLLKKLGIAPGRRVALLDAPSPPPGELATLPAGVTATTRLAGPPLDVIVLFAIREAALARRFAPAARRLEPAGGLWVAWPKRASGVATDLTEDRVRAIALAAGLVDNKVCAIDATWSGLRCVYRREDRPGGSGVRRSGGS